VGRKKRGLGDILQEILIPLVWRDLPTEKGGCNSLRVSMVGGWGWAGGGVPRATERFWVERKKRGGFRGSA